MQTFYQLRAAKWIGWILLGCLVMGIPSLAWLFHLRINATHSMPVGIYREINRNVNASLQRGNLVTVCLPLPLAQLALERNYLHAGICPGGVEPMFKQVIGVSGDVVDVTTKSISIDGKMLPHSQTFTQDQANRMLFPIKRGRRVLKSNEVWLYGQGDIYSWDSRYFGAIDRQNIQSIVLPVFIW